MPLPRSASELLAPLLRHINTGLASNEIDRLGRGPVDRDREPGFELKEL